MRGFIELVGSKLEQKASRKMRDFLDCLKVDYGVSQLEDYSKGDGPNSIGIFVDGEFFTYNFFLRNRQYIAKAICHLKEALDVAGKCLEGRCLSKI